MYQSIVQELGKTSFPAFQSERVHMRKFTKKAGLPSDLARWQETVDNMLEGVNADKNIFIMIDQQFVKSGDFHRRSGVHIDGYWDEVLCGHAHRHSDLNNISEGLIIASNVSSCRAYTGEYEGEILEGGDCSLIDTKLMNSVIFQENKIYAGNVTMLHESLPVPLDCYRTVVRLNVQGWQPH